MNEPSRTRSTVELDVKHITGTVAGATTLTVTEEHTEVVPPASGTHTITLPGAEEAGGRIFFVRSNGNDGGTVTVVTPDPTPFVSEALSADGDYVVLYSTGFRWVILRAIVAGVLTDQT